MQNGEGRHLSSFLPPPWESCPRINRTRLRIDLVYHVGDVTGTDINSDSLQLQNGEGRRGKAFIT